MRFFENGRKLENLEEHLMAMVRTLMLANLSKNQDFLKALFQIDTVNIILSQNDDSVLLLEPFHSSDKYMQM